MDSLTLKTSRRPQNTFKTCEIDGKKGDSGNMRNTRYLAFLNIGEGISRRKYTIIYCIIVCTKA